MRWGLTSTHRRRTSSADWNCCHRIHTAPCCEQRLCGNSVLLEAVMKACSASCWSPCQTLWRCCAVPHHRCGVWKFILDLIIRVLVHIIRVLANIILLRVRTSCIRVRTSYTRPRTSCFHACTSCLCVFTSSARISPGTRALGCILYDLIPLFSCETYFIFATNLSYFSLS